ncbi:40S ribosomal protein S11 [Pteropus alecto]|uniref:40S ribosomal protein S11 n=1 Tax=Pteropus alecto TaxID=9402 RepID=L5KW73_PTEAL|nr:40S ribosomal protein S11 [Pteropus alecto]
MKMQRTTIICRDYLHYIRNYNCFEKRRKNVSVHLSLCFRDVQIGDIVTVGEYKPLGKTMHFNILKSQEGMHKASVIDTIFPPPVSS